MSLLATEEQQLKEELNKLSTQYGRLETEDQVNHCQVPSYFIDLFCSIIGRWSRGVTRESQSLPDSWGSRALSPRGSHPSLSGQTLSRYCPLSPLEAFFARRSPLKTERHKISRKRKCVKLGKVCVTGYYCVRGSLLAGKKSSLSRRESYVIPALVLIKATRQSRTS